MSHGTAAYPARTLDLPSIKARHAELYDKVQRAKEELRRNPAKRRDITPELDSFIDMLKEVSHSIATTREYSDYDWLDTVATKWQEVFSWILAEPRNIRDEIEFPS